MLPTIKYLMKTTKGYGYSALLPDVGVYAHAHDYHINPISKSDTEFMLSKIVHAASVVLNFSENCTSELLQPYLDEIVGKLLVLLQNPKQMVQEGALTALASVADSSH